MVKALQGLLCHRVSNNNNNNDGNNNNNNNNNNNKTGNNKCFSLGLGGMVEQNLNR